MLTQGPELAGAAALVVMIHGRGQSATIMRAQATGLLPQGVRAVLPEAPDNVWYPRRFMEPLPGHEPHLSQAVATVEAIVAAAVAGGMPATQIVLLGFSQGGCLVSEHVRRHPRRYGGVVIWTGGLIGAPGTDWTVPEGLAGVPVQITGSDADPFVPEERTRETAAHFRAAGAEVALRVFPGRTHIVSAAEVADASRLIEAVAHRPG